MQKRKNIYLDPDTADFLDNKYVGKNPSYLVNHLLRAFAVQYETIVNKDIFADAIIVAIDNIKNEKEDGEEII
jgi:hypothetical protein